MPDCMTGGRGPARLKRNIIFGTPVMAARLLHLSAIYLVVGACLGMYMGISQNFSLMPVHAHVLLAGWLTMAMAGVAYKTWPKAATTVLARAHFWLHNLGLPVFMVGLGLMMTGHGKQVLTILVGASTFLLGLVCLALNFWKHVRN